MLQSPVSPESPRDAKDGARAFPRIHNYEAGLEVAPLAHQNREKNDLDPVVVLESPETPVRVHHGWEEAPQVIDTTAPQAMGDAPLEPRGAVRAGGSPHRESDAAVAEKGSTVEEERREPRRWCGVSRKVFLLILLLVVLLIAAIIGGAVGGTQARKHNKSTPEESNDQPSGNTTSPSKTTSSTSAATQSPHVRFRLQTYEEKNFKGASQLFVDPGLYKPAFPIMSYVWINSKQGDLQDPTPLLRCSVGFCKNSTLNGWRGASNMHQTGEGSDYKGDANFVLIGCDLVYPEPDCRDLGLDKPEATETVATVPIMETPTAENPSDTDAATTSASATRTSGSASTTSESGSSRTTQRSSSTPTPTSSSDSGSETSTRTQSS